MQASSTKNQTTTKPSCWLTCYPTHLIDDSPSLLRSNRRHRRHSAPRTNSLRPASRREGSCGTRAACCEGSFGTNSFPPVALGLRGIRMVCPASFHDRMNGRPPSTLVFPDSGGGRGSGTCNYLCWREGIARRDVPTAIPKYAANERRQEILT